MANLDQYGQPLRDPASAVLQRKYALAQALQKQGMDTSPVAGTGNTSMQAIARVLQGGLGGLLSGQVEGEAQAASDQQRAERAASNKTISDALALAAGGGPAAAPMPDRLGGAPPATPDERAALGVPNAPVSQVQQQALPAPGGATAAPPDLAPIIAQASQQSNVPAPLLTALLTQESRLGQDPRATANGGGVPQIISSTARQPGYGMAPISDADRLDPTKSIPWAAQYLAARNPGTDWNDPAQRDAGLRRYNGGGDPNYAANVTRHLGGAAERTGGTDMAGPGVPAGPQGVPPAALAQALQAPAAAATAAPPSGPTPQQLRQAAALMMGSDNPRAAAAASALNERANQIEQRAYRVEDRADAQRIAGETRAETARRHAIEDARDAERLGLARRQDQREDANQPLERIKNPDGSESMVPRSQAAGRVNAAPAPDTFGRSNTLRDEYRALTGDFRTVQTAFQNIQQASKSNNGAGDMSMLYSYVKMLDPGSVVRESEFATAAASGSFGERIQGAVQRVISGERLPDSLRQSFVTEAKNLHTTQRRTYDHVSQQYRGLAERNRLNPDDVVTDFITPEPAPPAAPAGTAPPAAGQPVRVGSVAEARQLPSGTPIILPDGSQGRVP